MQAGVVVMCDGHKLGPIGGGLREWDKVHCTRCGAGGVVRLVDGELVVHWNDGEQKCH